MESDTLIKNEKGENASIGTVNEQILKRSWELLKSAQLPNEDDFSIRGFITVFMFLNFTRLEGAMMPPIGTEIEMTVPLPRFVAQFKLTYPQEYIDLGYAKHEYMIITHDHVVIVTNGSYEHITDEQVSYAQENNFYMPPPH